MADYKVGDRVRVVGGWYAKGATGTVIDTPRGMDDSSGGVWFAPDLPSDFARVCYRRSDIIRIDDDAKAEPTCNRESETICPDPPSTLRTPAVFRSESHVIGGVEIVATCIDGKVKLRLCNNDLSESDVAVLLRTIETVMEQARRAKGVMG